jgi:hypothetical protein
MMVMTTACDFNRAGFVVGGGVKFKKIRANPKCDARAWLTIYGLA